MVTNGAPPDDHKTTIGLVRDRKTGAGDDSETNQTTSPTAATLTTAIKEAMSDTRAIGDLEIARLAAHLLYHVLGSKPKTR